MRWSILRQRSRSVARRRYEAAVELRCSCVAFELPGNMFSMPANIANSNSVLRIASLTPDIFDALTESPVVRTKPWLDSTPCVYYWTTLFLALTSERAWHEYFRRGLRDANAPIPIPVVFFGVCVGLCGGASGARPESEFAIRSRRPVFRHQVDRHKRKHFVQPRLRWPLRLEYYAANRPGHASRFL